MKGEKDEGKSEKGLIKLYRHQWWVPFFIVAFLYFRLKLLLLKLSQIINFPLSLFGIKIVKLSKLKDLQNIYSFLKLQQTYTLLNISDIEADTEFNEVYNKIKEFTIVDIERCYAQYKVVNYIVKKGLKGDFVECGVWKGGSMMMVAYLLIKYNILDRKIYLYDTFAGMTEPGNNDGMIEKKEWSKMQQIDGSNQWCYSSIDEVQNNMKRTGYPMENIKLIKGKVEDTLPQQCPDKIAMLRLDTDWYESTRHELIHLFPLVEKSGVLIVDDYGAWQGARKAVDEYFADYGPVFLNRIDYTGRLLIK